MKFSRQTLLAILATAGSMLLGDNLAAGGYIVNDLGAGGSFDPNHGYNLTGPQVFTGQGFGLAVEFGVAGNTPLHFGSVTMALAYRGGLEAADIILASDDEGRPGAAMETIHLTAVPTIPGLVTVSSITQSLLTPGVHYWIEALATGDTNMTWFANDQGASNDFSYRLDTGPGPGPWTFDSGAADPAFAVSTPDAAAAAVPSPSSLALLTIGIVGLTGRAAVREVRRR